jgi:hypothetical protein
MSVRRTFEVWLDIVIITVPDSMVDHMAFCAERHAANLGRSITCSLTFAAASRPKG